MNKNNINSNNNNNNNDNKTYKTLVLPSSKAAILYEHTYIETHLLMLMYKYVRMYVEIAEIDDNYSLYGNVLNKIA